MTFLVVITLAAAIAQQPETMSMLETPLYAPSFPRDVRNQLEADLEAARAAYAKDRTSADLAIALARAEVALGRVGDAIEVIAHGIEAKPDDARLYLERARALVVYRKFEAAERDARKALETIPEATCTLGLALYLRADFGRARDTFSKCSTPGVFLYLADRRAGGTTVTRPPNPSDADASLAPEIRLPGAVSSHTEKPRPTMTPTYLEAAEKIASEKAPTHGKKHPAEDQLKEIVEKNGNRWMEPIYIAAEADYARILKAEGKFKKPVRKKGKGKG